MSLCSAYCSVCSVICFPEKPHYRAPSCGGCSNVCSLYPMGYRCFKLLLSQSCIATIRMQRLLHGIKITLAVSRRIIGEVKVFNRPDGIYFTCLYCDKQHLLKSKEIIRDQKDFGISMKLLSWDGS